MADDDDALILDSRKYGGAYDGPRIGRELFRDALAALQRRGPQRPVRRLSVLVDSCHQSDYVEGVMRTKPGMDAVLAAPAMQRLEELRIKLTVEFLQSCEEYVLPASRVPGRFLRVLDLSGCKLAMPPPAGAAAFGLLETLEMRSCVSSPEDLQALLDAAPSLARLCLRGITFKTAERRGRVLLRCPGATVSVTVMDCHRTDGLDVDAPGARSLRYTGLLKHFPFGSPVAPPPANLQDVQLCFTTEPWCGDDLPASRDAPPHALFWEAVGRLSRLRALKLELLDINDIAVYSDEEGVFLGTFPDLKFLELQGPYEVDAHGAAVAIANLLLCCPALQEFHLNLKLHGARHKRTLHLSDERKALSGLEKSMESLKRLKSERIVASPSSGGVEFDDDGCGDDADLAALRACSFPCLESHLRKVRLEFELKCFDCFEVRLAKFLVQNALVLEEIEVHDGNQRVYNHIHHKLQIWRANSLKSKIKIIGEYHNGSNL